MTTSFRAEVARSIKLIWASRGQEPPTETLEAWCEGLEGLSVEQIAYGRKRYLQEHESEFKPNAAIFRRYCTTQKGIPLEVEAMFAFDQLVRNLERSRSPVFKNDVIAECVRRLGGWLSVCAWLVDELPFRKKEFCEIYVALRKTEERFDPKVPGESPELKLIGDFSEDEKTNLLRGPERKALPYSDCKKTDERFAKLVAGKKIVTKQVCKTEKYRDLAQRVAQKGVNK